MKRKSLVLICVLAVVFIIVSADFGYVQWSAFPLAKIPFSDSMAHFALLGSLSFVGTFFLYNTRSKRKLCLSKFSLALLIVMTLEEFSQIYRPTRSFSAMDIVGNTLGIILLGKWAMTLAMHYYLKPSSPIKGTKRNSSSL